MTRCRHCGASAWDRLARLPRVAVYRCRSCGRTRSEGRRPLVAVAGAALGTRFKKVQG